MKITLQQSLPCQIQIWYTKRQTLHWNWPLGFVEDQAVPLSSSFMTFSHAEAVSHLHDGGRYIAIKPYSSVYLLQTTRYIMQNILYPQQFSATIFQGPWIIPPWLKIIQMYYTLNSRAFSSENLIFCPHSHAAAVSKIRKNFYRSHVQVTFEIYSHFRWLQVLCSH